MVEMGLLWITNIAPFTLTKARYYNKMFYPSHHLGNYKGFRSSGLKPGTKMKYIFTISQFAYIFNLVIGSMMKIKSR